MTEQERRAELRKLAEAATQAKANGDTWMAVHPDTLTVLTEEIAALKEKVKRQAEALTLAANAYERGQRDGIAAAVKATQALYDLMLDAPDITVVSAKQYATDGLLDVIDALQALSPGEWVAVPAEKWTYGHCKEKVKPGGWKKLAVVDESYGHLERSDLHEKMRELSKKRGKSVE